MCIRDRSYNNPYTQGYEMQQPYGEQRNVAGSNDFVTFMNSINEINEGLDHYQQLINSIDVLQRRLLSEVKDVYKRQTIYCANRIVFCYYHDRCARIYRFSSWLMGCREFPVLLSHGFHRYRHLFM